MRKITKSMLVLATAITTATVSVAQTTTMRSHMLMTARMDGAQEVPSVAVNGTGITSFLLNATRDTLCISGTFNSLTGTPTSAHIHSGAAGVAGGVLLDLSSYVSGNRISAAITGTTLSSSLKSSMLKGLTYLNLHTAANAGGEIRGQIILESDIAYTGALDGMQSVPSVSTAANGYAVFNVAKHSGVVNFYVVTNGLSGAITSAHLHTGAMGVSGGVAQDLSTYINGNTIVGAFTPSTGVLASLKAGNIYLNVHTTANPGGEIRAQLFGTDKIAFDAWMSGAQATPSVNTTATGLTSLKLNTTMDTLFYTTYTNGLSGAITSAHLHNGAMGVSGGVAASFTTAVGNMISGTITGSSLSSTLINNLLKGNIYVNIHTSANPGGEIRGQVYRTLREGFTFLMNGAQEVPAVTSAGIGSGIVSIDRDQTNAHYMLVTAGVTSAGIHFHKGIMGATGAVINDLSSIYANNGAFGYWKNTDTSPFTLAHSKEFNSDSVYVNLHTSANAGGEIRGQVKMGYICNAAASVGINESAISNANQFKVYPNPTNNVGMISLENESLLNSALVITDILGNEVLKLNITELNTVVNLSAQSAGIYFATIKSQTSTQIIKLIKQ